jgi:hypothetical protein
MFDLKIFYLMRKTLESNTGDIRKKLVKLLNQLLPEDSRIHFKYSVLWSPLEEAVKSISSPAFNLP